MRALITGATSGIGYSLAKECAAIGYHLILTGRRISLLKERAHKLKKQYGCEIACYKIELSNHAERVKFIQHITRYKDIELLVNNAGFAITKRVAEADIKQLRSMLEVHCSAVMEITWALLPRMMANRRGIIINVSSPMGYLSLPSSALYCATKAFETNFSETLALELREYAIRVMALLPGLTKTDFHRSSGSWPFEDDSSNSSHLLWMESDEVARYAIRMIPKKRIVCIPGLVNRLLISITKFLPPALRYFIFLRFDRTRLKLKTNT